MHKAAYSSTTHDLLNGEKGRGLGGGVLGTLPWAHFFPLHPEDIAIGGRGREVSQPYQQDSTQHSNRWVPETAGGKGRVDE